MLQLRRQKNWARVQLSPWALGQGPARSLGPGLDQGPARSLGPRLDQGPPRSMGPGPDQGPARSMGPSRAQALAHVGFIGIHFLGEFQKLESPDGADRSGLKS